MQGRVNKRRFIVLVVLTVATLVAGWWVQPGNRFDIDEDLFRVDGLNEISRVDLHSPAGLVRLQFDGARWRVNDEYDADASMIRVLFATLQQAQPKRPVAFAHRDSVMKAVSESGVKVGLYAGDELRKEFYAGGNSEKTQAFFADPATGSVYVVTIPGYRVYVSGILELATDGWRDKLVFGFNWRNFKSLEARFPGNAAGDFTVAMQAGFFGIQGLPATDTTRLNNFLDDVSLLTVEEYLSEPKLIDSLKAIIPKMEILVTDVANRSYRLRLFDPGKSREGFILIQDSQAALINRRKTDELLKTRSFFGKK